MEFMARWPIVTRTRFNVLVVKYNQLRLDISVCLAEIKAEKEISLRARNELIEAKGTIQDLRMKLIEANAELLEQKVGGWL